MSIVDLRCYSTITHSIIVCISSLWLEINKLCVTQLQRQLQLEKQITERKDRELAQLRQVFEKVREVFMSK